MDTFKLLKIKNYFYHLVIGVFLVVFGTGVLQAIVTEMIWEYDQKSKIAYIVGILVCAFIILYSFYEIWKAFNCERYILHRLSSKHKGVFLRELDSEDNFVVYGQAIITKHYILARLGNNYKVDVIDKDKLIACFKPDGHLEKKATAVQVVLYDHRFRSYSVGIKGKGSEDLAVEFCQRILEEMPWLYSGDYDTFLFESSKIQERHKIVKKVDHDRKNYEAEPSDLASLEYKAIENTKKTVHQKADQRQKKSFNLKELKKKFSSPKSGD